VKSSDAATLASIAQVCGQSGFWVEPMSVRQLRDITSATSRGATRVQIVVILVVLFVGLIGNYGAASFSVAERTRTIGIRRALGATRRQIMRYFLEENLFVTTGGIILGLPLAIAVATAAERIQRHFILRWEHLVLAALFFYITSLWAAHAPALKAARVPPSVVSRAA
jgi:putative ABC transport system permease protein